MEFVTERQRTDCSAKWTLHFSTSFFSLRTARVLVSKSLPPVTTPKRPAFWRSALQTADKQLRAAGLIPLPSLGSADVCILSTQTDLWRFIKPWPTTQITSICTFCDVYRSISTSGWFETNLRLPRSQRPSHSTQCCFHWIWIVHWKQECKLNLLLFPYQEKNNQWLMAFTGPGL